jgi:arginine-tRNA-protein transferase
MQSLFKFVAPPSRCGYLPDQTWRLEYEVVGELSQAEYQQRMSRGWRRFGLSLFRPRCPSCQACRSLRVLVDRFRPNRSQERVRKLNEGAVRLRIGTPSVTTAKLELYDGYHAFQSDAKAWPVHPPKDVDSYVETFVDNPFPTEEWTYYLDGRLVAVSYVDALPEALSAMYCFYDPNHRDRSLGTWNILCMIAEATRRRIPHVYLGYYVAGCQSMEYKSRFVPNQILDENGRWEEHRP